MKTRGGDGSLQANARGPRRNRPYVGEAWLPRQGHRGAKTVTGKEGGVLPARMREPPSP